MTPALAIQTDADVLRATAHAVSLAAAAGCSPLDQTRVHLAALACASEARTAGASLTLEALADRLVIAAGARSYEFPWPAPQPGASTASVAASEPRSVDPAVLLEELTKTTGSARLQVQALQEELDETNRGVVALYSELDDRAEKLKRADELKSRFLSYASHELRTPLNGIVGLIRLLNNRADKRDPEEQKQLSFILRSAEEMREMVNDLLDLAKVEAGKVTIQPSEFGLDFVFGALRGIFRPLLQTDDVVLAFDDTSAVPSIYSDEAKVSQILRNFISNAIKFTEHGEVRVWAELEGDMVRISVRDSGIGIAQEHIERIFEEYAQIESPLQRRSRGTGLGLPLCRKLSHLLGGRIEVVSEPGRGSTFTLVLPRLFEPTAAPIDAEVTTRPLKPRSRPKVLIVDHAEIDRYLLTQLVRLSCGCDLLQASEGQQALDIAQRDQPDLIFLDINIPLLDYKVVLTELRNNPRTARIPVIAITARVLSDEERQELASLTVGIHSKEALADARALRIDFGPPVIVEVSGN